MRKIRKIIIHHSAVDQPDLGKMYRSINNSHKERLHARPNAFGNHIAYHYIIWIDGQVKHTRPHNSIGYHASNFGVNMSSIGIMLSWNFDAHRPTDSQYRALKELINKLEVEFGKLTIHFHREYAPKTCPWEHFNIDEILMWFYKRLRKDEVEKKVPREKRVFKNPDAFLGRIKSMSIEEKLNEMTYLMAFVIEKVGWNIE